ncbi:MAG TPA: DUF3048 domain-containing protein [bacterium]|nr:DUF3048 domain-containing protein [bacterium]
MNILKKIFKKKIILAIIALMAILLLAISGYILINKKAPITNSLVIKNIKSNCQFHRKLDGVCVTTQEEKEIWPVALMIDNHPDAWPQAGLSQAQVVYNCLVEGGTTRMMAVFANNDEIKKIGPIRSARPYYLDWVKEINALYGHSGGSVEALEKINTLALLDLNEISYLGTLFFYRDNNHTAPHNLFTDSEKIKSAQIYFNLATSTPTYQVWQFDPAETKFVETINEINIDYSAGSLFDIKYTYNTSTEKYLRFQNESPQIDANNQEQISVKNLIIQFIPEEIHLDAADRLSVTNTGQGRAWIFINGKLMRGNWQKSSSQERTIFYDFDGQEIKFQPGNIWLEIVPGAREVLLK